MPARAALESATTAALRQVHGLLAGHLTPPDEWPADLRPQPGRQSAFYDSRADITIYGGGVFGGKTYGLLIEPLQYVHDRGYGMVFFRRTYREIMREGGPWDEAERIFPLAGGSPKVSDYEWTFPGGGRVTFAHLEGPNSHLDWKGSSLAALAFDQLEEFQEKQFFYLIGRNRSPQWGGGSPYCKATCNPKPDSWLARLLDWWIDPEGYPIPERSGTMRYFVRGADDKLVWGDSREEAREAAGLVGDVDSEARAYSLRFIPALADDNPIGLAADPSYMSKLAILPRAERERLRRGNWKIRDSGGKFFEPVPVVTEHPGLLAADGLMADPIEASVLAWDYAATQGAGDYTAAVRADTLRSGRVVLWPRCEEQVGEAMVRSTVRRVTSLEPKSVMVHLPQDPGGSGKIVAGDLRREIQGIGYMVRAERVTGSKAARAMPLAAATVPPDGGVVGRVVIYDDGSATSAGESLAGRLVTVMHNFTGGKDGVDDLVDAAADAFNATDALLGRTQGWATR